LSNQIIRSSLNSAYVDLSHNFSVIMKLGSVDVVFLFLVELMAMENVQDEGTCIDVLVLHINIYVS